MHERGWLKAWLVALVPDVSSRQTAEFFVDQRHQPIQCALTSGAPIPEQLRYLSRHPRSPSWFSVLHFSVSVLPTETCRTEKYGSIDSGVPWQWPKR